MGWGEGGTDRSFQTSLFLLHPPKIQSPVAVFFSPVCCTQDGEEGEKEEKRKDGFTKEEGKRARVGVV